MTFLKELHKEHLLIENIVRVLGAICDKIEYEEELNLGHLRRALDISYVFMNQLYNRKEQCLIDILKKENNNNAPGRHWVGLITKRGKLDNKYKNITTWLKKGKFNTKEKKLLLAHEIRAYINSSLIYLQVSRSKHSKMLNGNVSKQQRNYLNQALREIEQEVKEQKNQNLKPELQNLQKLYLS